MITSDEILNKLAGILSVAIEPPPEEEEFIEVEPEQIIGPADEESNQKTIDITEDEKSIKVPLDDLSWSDPRAGSPDWVASNHPYVYLRGTGAQYLGYLNPANSKTSDQLVKQVLNKNPELYYEWEIDKAEPKAGQDAASWKKTALDNLIKSNPQYALILGVFQDRLQDTQLDKEMLGNLFKNAIASESKNYSNIYEMFPGVLHNRMQELVKTIKSSYPDLYASLIAGTEWEYRLAPGTTAPEQKNKLSSREPARGSYEWMAQNYPHTYLRGQNTMKHGFIREKQDPKIIQPLMDTIVKENPDKYFAWHLNLVGGQPRKRDSSAINFKDWLRPAISSIVDKSPYGALVYDVTRFKNESAPYLEKLWNNLQNIANNRFEQGLDPYPGQIAGSMRKLAGRMAVVRPDLYIQHVIGTRFEDKDFTDRAKQNLKQ